MTFHAWSLMIMHGMLNAHDVGRDVTSCLVSTALKTEPAHTVPSKPQPQQQ